MFRVGEMVILNIEDGKEPYHGYGGNVKNKDVGTVSKILSNCDIFVNFPKHKNWRAKPYELLRANINRRITY